MTKDFINLARHMNACNDTIVQQLGYQTSVSEYLREGSEAIQHLHAENERLWKENADLRSAVLDELTAESQRLGLY